MIEYNCRFGDPETQVVLPLLETDLMDIFLAVYEERLADLDIKWKQGAAACVVMASGGYPKKYPTGLLISGLNPEGQVKGATVYHAGTKQENGKYYTAGGRVLGVTAIGDNLDNALQSSYAAVKKLHLMVHITDGYWPNQIESVFLLKRSCQVGHFGFSYIGLIALLMLFIPNLFWIRQKPADYDDSDENKLLLAFERIGQVSSVPVALIFSVFNPQLTSPRSIQLFRPPCYAVLQILPVLLFSGEHGAANFIEVCLVSRFRLPFCLSFSLSRYIW